MRFRRRPIFDAAPRVMESPSTGSYHLRYSALHSLTPQRRGLPMSQRAGPSWLQDIERPKCRDRPVQPAQLSGHRRAFWKRSACALPVRKMEPSDRAHM